MTRRAREDEKLVEALLHGEERAVEELLDRHGGRIHRVARRVLSDEREAEEVTQDVLLTVVRKIHTFKGEAALSSWIYRITINAAYQRLRSRQSWTEVPLEPFLPVFDEDGRQGQAPVDWSAELDDPAVAAEVRAAIEQSLGRLPEEYRVIVLLRDVEGLSNEEVAVTLGLTVAAVKSRLHRARLFLRQELAHVFSPAR